MIESTLGPILLLRVAGTGSYCPWQCGRKRASKPCLCLPPATQVQAHPHAWRDEFGYTSIRAKLCSTVHVPERITDVSLILHNVRLFDGIDDALREHCDVIIDGDRITAIENTRAWTPNEHTVISAADCTLLPGLIDCHAHYVFDPWEPDPFGTANREPQTRTILRAARCARVALESGVTTTRDAGAPFQLNFMLRDAIAAGLVPGPRILAPGLAVTITGGHGTQFGRQADGLDELKKAVREQIRDGADVIKIIASEAAMLTTGEAGVEELTQEEIDVLVREARRRGLRIFSHAQNCTSLIRSARAGVDSVEHAFLADAEAIGVLKECGTTLVPTLTVTAATLEQTDLAPALRRRMLEIREVHWASCEEAIRQGVNVVAGTDCGVPGILPNMLWREIRLLHERGLSKANALRAATSRAAELLGVDTQVGTVEKGKQADLILVQGNPLDDLARLETVELVIKEGKIVHRKDGPPT